MPRLTLLLLLWGLSHHMIVTILAEVGHQHGDKNDPHGGVPMGIPSSFCDDGKNFTRIDWDPSSTDEYTCLEDVDQNPIKNSFESCDPVAKRPVHICYPQQISYTEDIPTSGAHRPLWPKYGEYRYLPPQRWLHSLEHGAIVFLYHPCANPDQIAKFKAIARNCLRRHIITPSKRVRSPNMFAVASWKCKMVMTYPQVHEIVRFIRQYALHAPERSVYTDGQYSQGLIHHAKMVSDKEESNLCPGMSMMALMRNEIQSKSLSRQHRLREMRRELEMISYEKLARDLGLQL